MSEVIIRARSLAKIYRLYTKPQYRFLDMFGLLRKSGAYTEHAALAGIDVEIRRGEKVAVIGRNGAGKSTLLKLVTGAIEPTSGVLEVVPGIHALLQIGAGFHPDFSGRQNVRSFLAHLGLAAPEVARKVDEVIQFSELEEYIDQPIKTYSTGMTARLMFSVSTAVAPDILVIDEVLGVGDAYFTQKSYERIRELCSGGGTTVLLVSHDVYGASRLCERMIWIDQGKILIDGASPDVIKAYEDSIRAQEERRLRLRKQRQLKGLEGKDAARQFVTVEVSARDNRPQPCPVHFSSIELLRDHVVVASLPLGEGAFEPDIGSHLQREGTNWGDLADWQGRRTRPLLHYGSPFHKGVGVFSLRLPSGSLEAGDLSVRLKYGSDEPCEFLLRLYLDGRAWDLGPLPASRGAWLEHTAAVAGSTSMSAESVPVQPSLAGVQGTGVLGLDNVSMLDANGNEAVFLEHGKAASLVFDYRIAQPGLKTRAQATVNFHKDGVHTSCRVFTRELEFDWERAPKGTIRVHLPRLPLGQGMYTVTVMIVRENYYDEDQTIFYTLNPGVFVCLSRVLEIRVTGGGLISDGTCTVIGGEWEVS